MDNAIDRNTTQLRKIASNIVFAANVAAALALMPQHAYTQGLIPEDPAVLAKLPHLPPYRAFLPLQTDLSGGFPDPRDQGRQGSCVAWSVGYALRTYYDHLRRGTSLADDNNLFSPAFVYNQIVHTPGQCNSGSRISDALVLLQSDGIASLAEFPYDPRFCSALPDPAVREHAREHTIFGFAVVDRGNLDDVKGRLAAGDPVVIGMRLNDYVMKHLGPGGIYNVDAAGSNDSHAIVIVGHDDTRQAFKFFNSWGPYWGDRGFGWMSYGAYLASVHDAFTVTDIAPPTPPPAPEPAPPPQPEPVAWQASLSEAAAGLKCARVKLRATDQQHGMLSGWVGSETDFGRLKEAVAQLPEGVDVKFDVLLRPWPQCEALMTLDDVIKRRRGLELAAVGNDGGDYGAGSRLILRLRTPTYPAYVYVTYLQAGGDAVQLYQPLGTVPAALPPNSTVVLGGDDDRRKYRIGPPFGHEMVVAVASASPLFADGLGRSMTEREYLTALRKALLYKPDPKQRDRVVDAATVVLTTHDAAKP